MQSAVLFLLLTLLSLVVAEDCNTNRPECGVYNNRECPDPTHPSHLKNCCEEDRNGCATACCADILEPGFVTIIIVAVLLGLCCLCPLLTYCCRSMNRRHERRQEERNRRLQRARESSFDRREHARRRAAGIGHVTQPQAPIALQTLRAAGPAAAEQPAPPAYYGDSAPDYDVALNHPISHVGAFAPSASASAANSASSLPPATADSAGATDGNAATATPASATNADEVLRVLRPTPRRILLAPARPAGDDADGAANDSSDGARARRGTLWDRPDVASTDVTPAYTAVDATSASAADAARAPPQAEAGEGEEHGELPPAYSDVAQREER